jgi:excisionase family DNA binding protein
MPVEPLLLTARQAAAALTVSERTLWALTKCGAISCIRIGRAVRYDPADLQAFIASRKSAAPIGSAGGIRQSPMSAVVSNGAGERR